jgi:hypothetical protein
VSNLPHIKSVMYGRVHCDGFLISRVFGPLIAEVDSYVDLRGAFSHVSRGKGKALLGTLVHVHEFWIAQITTGMGVVHQQHVSREYGAAQWNFPVRYDPSSK